MLELAGEEWVTSAHKRSMDIMLSTALLPVAAPLAVGAAALIRTVDGVDPLFSQERPGAGGEPFTIYKLRTMPGVTEHVASVGGYNDPRASKFGRLLRRIRLDEVPQLWNIYQNDMSVVGPRPILSDEYEAIMDGLSPGEQKDWQHARTICKPGMVDSFGVKSYQAGYAIDTAARVEADIAYAHTATFKGDVKILASCFGLMPSIFSGDKSAATVPVHEYKRGAKILETAAGAFGISLEEEDINHWDAQFRIVRVLDNLVDENGVTDLSPIIDGLFGGVGHEAVHPELSSQFHAAVTRLLPDKQASIRQSLAQIPVFAAQKKAATTATELVSISRQEAICFASVLHLEETDDPSRIDFNNWLTDIAQAGELLDSSIDLRSDYEAGVTAVRPGVRNSLIIAGMGLKHMKTAVKSLDFQTGRRLVSAARACYQDR